MNKRRLLNGNVCRHRLGVWRLMMNDYDYTEWHYQHSKTFKKSVWSSCFPSSSLFAPLLFSFYFSVVICMCSSRCHLFVLLIHFLHVRFLILLWPKSVLIDYMSFPSAPGNLFLWLMIREFLMIQNIFSPFLPLNKIGYSLLYRVTLTYFHVHSFLFPIFRSDSALYPLVDDSRLFFFMILRNVKF